jgi:murein DD-endopeptidase
MQRRLLFAVILALLVPARLLAQPALALPIPLDIIAGPPPQPLAANGRIHLLYELRVTNFGAKPIELTKLDVLGDGGAIASYLGDDLDKLVMPIGPADPADKTRVVGPGHVAVAFLDLVLPPGASPPKQLRHRLSASAPTGVAETVEGPMVTVVRETPPVLHPPVSGAGWVAAFGLSSPNHRRSLLTVDARTWISSRFAIDWVRLGPEGRLFHEEPGVNTNFYGYGAEVLAVGDGRIIGRKDGIADNAGLNQKRATPMTLETIPGNALMLDLGHGRYAVYDHLQPGSLRVQIGDKVRAGDVLARLGNSGNSDAPHLHFQLVDRPVHVAAEGIPYELEAFTQVGVVANPDQVLAGQAWIPERQTPTAHRREFPVDNAVVSFP